jgi:hypothetical protein
MARRLDVRNSLTEKCEMDDTLDDTRFTGSDNGDYCKLEQGAKSACSSSSHRQFGFNFGIPSALSKSTARTSASSSTRSGLMATTRHCNRRRAWSRFGFLISFKTRSYVSSNDSGNSSRVRRTLGGRQSRRISSWQNTHLNLNDNFRRILHARGVPLTCHWLVQRAS